MEARKEMSRDRKENRRDREVIAVLRPVSRFVFLSVIVAVVLAVSTATGLAAEAPPTGESAKTPDQIKTPTFPYTAEITGDNVYFRSGPGTNFYECGKLNKGDKVKVVSKQFTWYRIVPPPKSFAWISTQYVKVDPANPESGILTGDRVRVYAGSDRVRPHYSTSLLGKLNEGERVKLLGQQLDDYYKIAPPPSAYLWVSTYFTKPLPPEKKVPPIEKVTPPVKPLAPGDVPPVVKIDTSKVPTDTIVKPPATKPAPEKVAPITPSTPLERYQALQKRIEAELKKLRKEQDYKDIKKELTEISNDENADKVAKYAKKVLQRVEALELAISVDEQLRLQNELLNKKTEGIDKARAAKLAEIKNMGQYAIIGWLQTFTLFGKGHYRILDESGKMLCYALPSKQIKLMDLSSLIGKKVGLKGMIQPHLPTRKAMIRFSEIVELK
jgi:uncharacterized protein YgiM (DUF1202 family)